MNQIYHGDEAYYLMLLFQSNTELKEETYNCGLYEESSSDGENDTQNSYEKLSYSLGDYFADMPEEVSSGLSATDIYDTELEKFNLLSERSFLDDIQAIVFSSYGTVVPWHLNCNRKLYITILKVVLYGAITNLFYENRYRFLPNYEWYLIDKNERRKVVVNTLFKQYDRWVDAVNGIKNCVDVDAVPDRYLNYLMELTGLSLHNYNKTLSEKQIRSLINNIIEVWRTKGSIDSIKLFFQCMGITANVKELYFDRRLYYTPYSPWSDIAVNGEDISEYVTTSVDGYSALFSNGAWSDISRNNDLVAHTWVDSISMSFDSASYKYYMTSEDGYIVSSEDGLKWNWWYSDGQSLLGNSVIKKEGEEGPSVTAYVSWKKSYSSVIDNKNVLCFLGHITSFSNNTGVNINGVSNVLAYTTGEINEETGKPIINYKFIQLLKNAAGLDPNKIALGIYSFELKDTTKAELLFTEDGAVLISYEKENSENDFYKFSQLGSISIDETSDINTWVSLKIVDYTQFIAVGDHGIAVFNIEYENNIAKGLTYISSYYITDKDISGIIASEIDDEMYKLIILTTDGYIINAYYDVSIDKLEIDSTPTSSTITNRVNTSTDIQGRENYAFYLTPNTPHTSVYEFSSDAVNFNETGYPITESVWTREFKEQLEKITIEEEGEKLPEFDLERDIDCDEHFFAVKQNFKEFVLNGSFKEERKFDDKQLEISVPLSETYPFAVNGLFNGSAHYSPEKLFTFSVPKTVNYRKEFKVNGNFNTTDALPSYNKTSDDEKKLAAIRNLLGYGSGSVAEKFTYFKTNWLLVSFTKIIGINEYKAVSDEEEVVFEELMLRLLPSFVKVIYKRSADAKDETLNFNIIVDETEEGFVLRIEDNYYKYINYTGDFRLTGSAKTVELTRNNDVFTFTVTEPDLDIDRIINTEGKFDWQGFSYGISEAIDDLRNTEEIRYSSVVEPGTEKE